MKLKLMLVALAAAGLVACGNEQGTTESKAPAVSTAPAQPAQPAEAAAATEQQKLADAKAATEAAAPAAKEEAKEEGKDPKDSTEQEEKK